MINENKVKEILFKHFNEILDKKEKQKKELNSFSEQEIKAMAERKKSFIEKLDILFNFDKREKNGEH